MKEHINENEHVGRTCNAIDLGSMCSPAIHCITDLPLPPGTSQRIIDGFNGVLEGILGPEWKWSLRQPEPEIRSYEIEPPGVWWNRFNKAMEPHREEWRRQASERKRSNAEHPKNGTLGWWRVDGIRHSATVRAVTATEALEKSEIDSWESPDVEWIGEELPDVIDG